MATANIFEREAFSKRFKEALEKAGIRASPTLVARQLKLRGGTVSVHGVRKWLECEAIPVQSNLRLIATWLGLTPEFLRFGKPGDDTQLATPQLQQHQYRLLESFERLIDRDQQLVQSMIDHLITNPPEK